MWEKRRRAVNLPWLETAWRGRCESLGLWRLVVVVLIWTSMSLPTVAAFVLWNVLATQCAAILVLDVTLLSDSFPLVWWCATTLRMAPWRALSVVSGRPVWCTGSVRTMGGRKVGRVDVVCVKLLLLQRNVV